MPNDQFRLAVLIEHADGTTSRWGPDEPNAENIAQGISFSTSVPGGFKDCTLTLSRRIDKDYADLRLFDSVTVYGIGGRVVWEGRVAQLPAQHGDTFSIQVGCVGHSAHLRDDASFREIYVDRDLSRWGGPGVARRLALVAANYTPEDPSAQSDSAQPSLACEFTGDWTALGKRRVEGWYDARGLTIGSIYYAWMKSPTVGAGPDNWLWSVNATTDDVATSADSTGDLQAAGPGTGTLTATATKKFGAVYFYFDAANTDTLQYGLYWTCLAVYGNHGLTKRGTADATNAQGFYGSDIIVNVVSRAAPLLTYTTGAGGSIEADSFVIPQAAYLDPSTAEDVILDVNKYYLKEWGVYEGKQFFWRAPDPDRLTWQARLSDGAQISLEGDDANNVYNGVVVSYTDGAGVSHTVGPPGSDCENTDATLVDTTATNPVNAAGIPNRYGVLAISQVTTLAGATQIGYVWLLEHSLPQRRGQLTLKGTATHPTKGQRPVDEIRGGDWITIADRPGDVARRIIETGYDADNLTLVASLDNTVFKLEGLLERMGVEFLGIA